MRKQAKMLSSVVLTLMMVFSVVFLPLTAETAKAKTVEIDGVSYNAKASLGDNLKSLVGKRVSVTLDSGKTLAGVVKDVGTHLLHLEKLDGKDFFDALIRIENIGALDVRFREFQR